MADPWNDSDAKATNGTAIDMASISSAVEDIANGQPKDDGKEADTQRARDAGWVEKTAYDYSRYEGGVPEWLKDSKVYEWDQDYGDVGPEVPALEKALYGDEYLMKKGNHMEVLDVEVEVEGPERVQPIKAFADAGLHPIVLQNVIKCGYQLPTPIQAYVIPIVKLGKDVVGNSQTGSGKTGAYLIPVISGLMGKAKKLAAPRPFSPSNDPRSRVRAEPLVVIVVPTRELALQIFNEACRMCYRSMLRPCVLFGGRPMSMCIEDLGKGCDILIATPGRLCDVMNRPEVLSLSRVRYTIIDEADEMLAQDWQQELNMIMSGGDNNEDPEHVYMMFSATFPEDAQELARECMGDDFYRVKIGHPEQTHRNIDQDVIEVAGYNKEQAAFDLLCAMKPARTLIFCNSKHVVDKLDDFLYNRGLPTTSIHSDRLQIEREDAFRNFRSGRAPILIATGVSSRGWDVMGVEHVINYDLPSALHGGILEYIHRIGRTGRIGNRGKATSFFNPDRDEEMAAPLVRCLEQCGCPVPDFLRQAAQSFTGEGFGGENNDAGDSSQQTEGWGASSGDANDQPAEDAFSASGPAPIAVQ